jgi:two-component sensor histidine kinase
VGLPHDFDMRRGGGLGMRLAIALAQQTEASIEVSRVCRGTEFVIVLPMT